LEELTTSSKYDPASCFLLPMPAGRSVEHPLDRPIKQHGVRQVGYLAIKPKVNTGDGRGLEAPQLFRQSVGGLVRKKFR